MSFGIRRGETLGLIGENGAGKTTLFECLAGVQPADAGMISFGEPASEQRRPRSSVLFYVPDAIAPWPAQSVRWALDFTLGIFGGRFDLREEIVQRLDIGPLLDTSIGTLSKGQRKRALLAIGLLTPQPMLLAELDSTRRPALLRIEARRSKAEEHRRGDEGFHLGFMI